MELTEHLIIQMPDRSILRYEISFLEDEDDCFITFIDKYGHRQQIAKKLILKRWQE